MSGPLAIDLYCGLGGWAEGLLAEGYDVVGFDIERHRYPEMARRDAMQKGPVGGSRRNAAGESVFKDRACHLRDTMKNAPLTGRWAEYPGHLVIQDVRTLHGRQFRGAALIVASPPCQEYSYMAMPWKLGRAKAEAIRNDATGRMLADLNALFHECFRIQKEASVAAGRHIPMVVENVRGAQRWVGRARWNFGSYYLWGDVPALMPVGLKGGDRLQRKADGIKEPGRGAEGWFGCYAVQKAGGTVSPGRLHGKNHPARKAASAMIAKIPEALARHIASVYKEAP